MTGDRDPRAAIAALFPALAKQPSPAPDDLIELMEWVYRLYSAVCTGLSEERGAALEGFLKDAAPRLEPIVPWIDLAHGGRIETCLISRWESEEWLVVCRLRSAREAFNELFVPFFSDPEEGFEEDEELDALLRSRGESEGFQDPARTPSHFPARHWWWSLSSPSDAS